MRKNLLLYITVLIGLVNSVQSQTFKLPENYPNAYTEYIYDANDLKILTETYEKNVPKFSFPPNVNNVKEANVLLDIYYCENSNVNIGLKPLIVFSPGGGREKSDYKQMASDLAKRGFVVISINIRGNTLNKLQLLFNSKNLNPFLTMGAAMEAHNAIHYILDQRAKALSVDPNYVILGGGSFGGAISLQGAFMDREEAAAKFGNNVNNAFFNSYDSKLQVNNIKGVLDLYGAMYDVNFIKPTETKPVFIFHGSADPAVPYMEGNLFYNPLDVYFYGAVKIFEKLKENNNNYYFVTGKDVGHTITPQCNYDANSFPNGYPMNWYPDMLYFIKNAILQNKTIKVIKTVECIEPECSISKNSCRVVVDDANNGSRKASNAVIPTPNFNKEIAALLPNILKTEKGNGSASEKPTTSNTFAKLDHCKAYSFDGDDFIRITNSPSLTESFDLEFWFKQSATNPENNLQILLSIGTSRNIRNSAFTFGLLGNNQIYIGYFNGNTYIEKIQNITDNQNKNYLIDNNWHHYHIKISNTNFTGEIDGNKGNFNFANAIVSPTNTAYNSNTYFGGADFNTGSINYKYNNAVGQMHEIRLWKIGYSYDYHNVVVTNSIPGLNNLWKLNSNTQIIKDDGIYKVDATLGSNASEEKFDPTFVNNCDGAVVEKPKVVVETPKVIPETPKQEPVVVAPTPTPKSDSVKVPLVIKDGINIINTNSKPIIMFTSTTSGKASVKIFNSNKKLISSRLIVFSKGTTALNNTIKSLIAGNYNLIILINKKTYSQNFIIPK